MPQGHGAAVGAAVAAGLAADGLGRAARTLLLRETYAQALYNDPEATEDDLLEAVAMLEKLLPEHKRIFGPLHPRTVEMQKDVDRAKIMLRLFRARAARAASRSVQDAADTPEAS